jgi:hypothetical protein
MDNQENMPKLKHFQLIDTYLALYFYCLNDNLADAPIVVISNGKQETCLLIKRYGARDLLLPRLSSNS